MTVTRRDILKGLAATPAIIGSSHVAHAADTRVIKLSHQFPGGTADTGDFRDRLTRKFAAEVEKRTGGSLKFEIYPGSSLMKTVAQFSALRKGALDMSLYPLAYAGGEVQELNIGLMPCMVTSYEQGFAWKKAEIGRELVKLLDAKGVKIVTWIWQAGGIASRANPVVEPADARGLKFRGGSREMDLMLKEAGAIISSVPSNEIYAAMQTGSLDAALTSSTSLISFRLEEVSKGLTTGRGKSFWYMLEPLIISKSVYDSLTPAQQKAVSDVGQELESFATATASSSALAEAAAWPDFSKRNAECDRFLKMAKAVA